MQAISPVFALSLANVVRHAERQEADADEDTDTLDDDPKKRDKERRSEADWWKRGEAPPF